MRAFFVLGCIFFSLLAKAQIVDELNPASTTMPVADSIAPIIVQPMQPQAVAADSAITILKHSPKKATLLSLVIPGAGQIYNRKNWWWKVPIIYGGGGALVYGTVFYQKAYKEYQQAYAFKLANPDVAIGNPSFDRYQTPTLKNFRDDYRESRDQCLIGLLLLYTMQIIDASVEAHFFDFNVTDDLSLNIQPEVGMLGTSAYTGFQFTFTLK